MPDSQPRVLVVDDEPGVLFMLKEVLRDRKLMPVVAASGEEALAILNTSPGKSGDAETIEAALVDLAMPGISGLDLIPKIHEIRPDLPVILITAHGSERVAVTAMQAGAFDYLRKPIDIDELGLSVERAIEVGRLRRENRRLAAERAIGKRFIAESAPMKRLFSAIERVASKDVTVLICGETGTGKEVVAALVHAQSARKKQPFIRFNCAALPADLAEAELFGHVRGAFTGAVQARRGYFAQAHGGTLLLDEIGELSLALQPKLLRVLQEGEIQPIGSGRTEKVDVRLVASTNRDLKAEVQAGRFREDLYYRLAVVELNVPSLRERRDEIPALALEFSQQFADKFGLQGLRLSEGLVRELAKMEWPGNVRQLENTIARLVALSSGGEIDASALHETQSTPSSAPAADTSSDENEVRSDSTLSLREQVENFERGLLLGMLQETGWNQSEAARRLGIGRATLIDKMRKYELTKSGSDTTQ